MADFEIAVGLTLKYEGGFSDNPADPGGATYMGVEQRDLPDVPIRELTVEQAKAYYQEAYWKPLYSQIVSQPIANKIFDLGVLFGVGTAVSILQLTLSLKTDGQFGLVTLAAVNAAEPNSLLEKYKVNLVTHAFNVATAKPATRVFLKGWSTRINS